DFHVTGVQTCALPISSSIPTMEMSSGMRSPASRIASIAPNAVLSLIAITPVGTALDSNNWRIWRYPLLEAPLTGLTIRSGLMGRSEERRVGKSVDGGG